MEEGVKKSYSIWSLLVIMTLLAVLLSLPKPTNSCGPMIHALLAGSHQVALWVLFGRLIWMLTGKRRSVLIAESIVAIVVWGPLFIAIAEDVLGGGMGKHTVVRTVLSPLGLYDAYGQLYQWIFKTFGYGGL